MATASPPLAGLALPAIRGLGGYFASKDRYDVAWGDLIIALFTPIGSRPMRRDFGSGLYDLLFQLTGPALTAVVDQVVRDTAAKWVPHVLIRSVDVRQDHRTVSVGVSFSLADDRGASTTKSVAISKSDYAKILAAGRNT